MFAMEKDFGKIMAILERLKNHTKCSKCLQAPEPNQRYYMVPICGHQLCQNCYDPGNWSGKCPATGCLTVCNRKDVNQDRQKGDFLQHSANMKTLLESMQGPSQEPSASNANDDGAKVIFSDMDTDVDLDNVDIFNKAPEKQPLAEISNVQETKSSQKTTMPSSFLAKENEDFAMPSLPPTEEYQLPAQDKPSTSSKRQRKTRSFLMSSDENEDIVPSSIPHPPAKAKAKPSTSTKRQRTTKSSLLSSSENEDIVPSSIPHPPAKAKAKPSTSTRRQRTTKPSPLSSSENEDIVPSSIPHPSAKAKPSTSTRRQRTTKPSPLSSSENEDIVPSSIPLPEEKISVVSTTKKKAKFFKSKLNKRNKKGETPLHEACVKRDLQKVQDLLSQGAEPNTQDNNSWTPLHEVAPYEDSIGIVQALLDHGANPNVPGGDFNSTPLHEAAAAGCVDICKLLIQKTASKTARNSLGQMPYDVAANMETRTAIDETLCDMSDTEQMETTVLLNASTVPERFVLLPHQLRPEQLDLLKNSLKKLDSYTIATKFTDDVTHVIVNLNQDTSSCDADIQFFQSLLTGKWILDFKWFEESVNTGSFHSESDYVAIGCNDCRTGAPALSKTNASNRLPRLFDGCHFYLSGSFQSPYPGTSELRNLLKDGGGTILRREPDPEYIPLAEQKVPYHVKMGSSLAKCSHYIIYQEGQKEPLIKYNMDHIKTLPAAWLFECIKNFAIVEPFN